LPDLCYLDAMTYSPRTPAHLALGRVELNCDQLGWTNAAPEDIDIVREGLLTEIEVGVLLGALDIAYENIPKGSKLATMVTGLIGKLETMSPE
jgi:hypothetical protein